MAEVHFTPCSLVVLNLGPQPGNTVEAHGRTASCGRLGAARVGWVSRTTDPSAGAVQLERWGH